jgi:hypothetical protein
VTIQIFGRRKPMKRLLSALGILAVAAGMAAGGLAAKSLVAPLPAYACGVWSDVSDGTAQNGSTFTDYYVSTTPGAYLVGQIHIWKDNCDTLQIENVIVLEPDGVEVNSSGGSWALGLRVWIGGTYQGSSYNISTPYSNCSNAGNYHYCFYGWSNLIYANQYAAPACGQISGWCSVSVDTNTSQYNYVTSSYFVPGPKQGIYGGSATYNHP